MRNIVDVGMCLKQYQSFGQVKILLKHILLLLMELWTQTAPWAQAVRRRRRWAWSASSPTQRDKTGTTLQIWALGALTGELLHHTYTRASIVLKVLKVKCQNSVSHSPWPFGLLHKCLQLDRMCCVDTKDVPLFLEQNQQIGSTIGSLSTSTKISLIPKKAGLCRWHRQWCRPRRLRSSCWCPRTLITNPGSWRGSAVCVTSWRWRTSAARFCYGQPPHPPQL